MNVHYGSGHFAVQRTFFKRWHLLPHSAPSVEMANQGVLSIMLMIVAANVGQVDGNCCYAPGQGCVAWAGACSAGYQCSSCSRFGGWHSGHTITYTCPPGFTFNVATHLCHRYGFALTEDTAKKIQDIPVIGRSMTHSELFCAAFGMLLGGLVGSMLYRTRRNISNSDAHQVLLEA